MNKIKTAVFAGMMIFTSMALADGVPATKTYEVSINSFRAPLTANGTVTLRECDECDYHAVRVTGQTRYLINGTALRLEDFRKRVVNIRLAGDTTVNVIRNEATGTVSSVYLNTQ